MQDNRLGDLLPDDWGRKELIPAIGPRNAFKRIWRSGLDSYYFEDGEFEYDDDAATAYTEDGQSVYTEDVDMQSSYSGYNVETLRQPRDHDLRGVYGQVLMEHVELEDEEEDVYRDEDQKSEETDDRTADAMAAAMRILMSMFSSSMSASPQKRERFLSAQSSKSQHDAAERHVRGNALGAAAGVHATSRRSSRSGSAVERGVGRRSLRRQMWRR